MEASSFHSLSSSTWQTRTWNSAVFPNDDFHRHKNPSPGGRKQNVAHAEAAAFLNSLQSRDDACCLIEADTEKDFRVREKAPVASFDKDFKPIKELDALIL